MGLNCGCPQGQALASLNIAECKESMGQIQKIIIQRVFSTAGTKNSVTEANLKSQTAVAALLAATDGTKMVISPYIQNPETTPGEARTFGGGNQTLGGVELVIGREATSFTGIIYQESQATIKTMKGYGCENIGVYLVDENGNIGCIKSGSNCYPIPVQSFFVGDKKLGGFEEPDSNAISWKFMPNWSDDFAIITGLDYNPLTDLVNS